MTRAEYAADKRTKLTGVLWKPLTADGIEGIYLISENRQVYNFIRCRMLTAQGESIRLRGNGGLHSCKLDALMLAAFPERYQSSEEWRGIQIAGEPSGYEVSRSGRIRRKDNHHILKPTVRKDGFCFIQMSREGRSCSGLVHRFVAGAFLENPDECRYVRHKDGNRLNNAADNLEWCSRKEL